MRQHGKSSVQIIQKVSFSILQSEELFWFGPPRKKFEIFYFLHNDLTSNLETVPSEERFRLSHVMN